MSRLYESLRNKMRKLNLRKTLFRHVFKLKQPDFRITWHYIAKEKINRQTNKGTNDAWTAHMMIIRLVSSNLNFISFSYSQTQPQRRLKRVLTCK